MLVNDSRPTSEASPERATDVRDALRPLNLPLERLSTRDLVRVVRAVARRPQLFDGLVVDSVEERWSMLLLGMNNYEVRLLSWEREQTSDWHDHGGSSGAFVVTSGALTEDYRAPDGVGTRTRLFVEGQVGSFGATHVHDVTYLAGRPAVSVHAYSPPLGKMTYYDRTAQGFVARELICEERRGTVLVP